jgi:hypothetical protein
MYLSELCPPSEPNDHSANQETPSILQNSKIQYNIHNSPPLISIVGQINPVHPFPTYFFQIHFNITIPYMSKSFK